MIQKEESTSVLDVADSIIPYVSLAFTTALASYIETINVLELETALGAGNLEEAEDIIAPEKFKNFLYGIGVATSASFVDLLHNSYTSGGKTAIIGLLPELQKLLIFDLTGERIVADLRQQALISTNAATKTITEGVRQLLSNKAGVLDNVKEQAKAIVNSIGLTSSQAKAVSNYRRQLESSKVLGLTNPLNRKIDPIDFGLIQQQMTSGNLNAVDIDKLVNNYSRNLINKHALDVARTETLNAINSGRQELWEQAIDQGVFSEDVSKHWVVTPDDRLRATHAAIPLMNPYGVPIRNKFNTPFGPVNGPQDRRVELINCRCVLVLDASVAL